MAGHPNSLANLRRPWLPGEQGTAGVRYVDRMVTRAQRAAPHAIRLLTQAMKNPELPMSTRLRCAEYIVDKTWPKDAPQTLLGGLTGVEWLELRFTAPGGQQTETHRISLEPTIDNDIRDITPDANGLENGDE